MVQAPSAHWTAVHGAQVPQPQNTQMQVMPRVQTQGPVPGQAQPMPGYQGPQGQAPQGGMPQGMQRVSPGIYQNAQGQQYRPTQQQMGQMNAPMQGQRPPMQAPMNGQAQPMQRMPMQGAMPQYQQPNPYASSGSNVIGAALGNLGVPQNIYQSSTQGSTGMQSPYGQNPAFQNQQAYGAQPYQQPAQVQGLTSAPPQLANGAIAGL